MTIAEAREKCKSLVAKVPRDVLIIIILILASVFSFGLGYLAGLDAGQQGGGIVVKESPATALAMSAGAQAGKVVASKSGTKYFLPWCAGVERISDANKVSFSSADSAQAAGYAPADNCKGL